MRYGQSQLAESKVKRAQDAPNRQLIIDFKGGLGNQLFQYAAGLYFSQRLNMALDMIQPASPNGNQQIDRFSRPFQLDAFSLSAKVRPASSFDRLFLSKKPRFRFLCSELQRISNAQALEEPLSYRFFPDFLDMVQSQTTYLSGYWQAAGYAQSVEVQLRTSLVLKNTPLQRNLDYAEAIRSLTCPVSVHIRVGDYAFHSATNTKGAAKVSWVLPRSYYRAAIATIRSLVPEATFVVFSDDQASAREIMAEERVGLWVEGNDVDSAYEDLWLMSSCDHHIIANSSFSWWGAWLNGAPQKTVIAPKYWFNTHHSYFPDLYPSGWTFVDNLAM
jgi:Glycosyl transferase family 11